MGVAITRRVLAPIGFLIGEPVEVAAGLAGTEVGADAEAVRIGFAGTSCLTELATGSASFSRAFVAGLMMSLPGG